MDPITSTSKRAETNETSVVLGLCQCWATTQLREPGSDFFFFLKMDVTTLFHVQKGAACLGFEPGCSVTLDFRSLISACLAKDKTQDPKTGVVFAALNIPDLFFICVKFNKCSSNTGILNP